MADLGGGTTIGGYPALHTGNLTPDIVGNMISTPIDVSGSSNVYSATVPNMSNYVDLSSFTVRCDIASTGAVSLNFSGLGAKPLVDYYEQPVTDLPAGAVISVVYNAKFNSGVGAFMLQGKGGGGTATAAQILTGFSATVKGGKVNGNMPENGALNANLNCGQSFNVPAGHTTGGTITANSLASQTQANADASKILSGFSAWVNGVLVNGNYDSLTLVAGDSLILFKSTVNLGDGNAVYHVVDTRTLYGHGGTVRIKFSMTSTGQSSGIVGYARIYINGSPRGIERSVAGLTPITFTEDFSVNTGDVIQLYTRAGSGGYSMSVTNYTISCGNDYAYLS